jgi:hypothetical protein
MPLKWLLIGLMVVSFAGRPWAQAFASAPSHGCGGAAAAMTHAADVAAAHQQLESLTTATGDDSAKAMGAGCIKSCAAAPMLIQLPVVWSPDIWPQAHSAAVIDTLRGHPLKPELAPPIALI